MFLPIILDPFSFNTMRYRWQFQKFLWYSYCNKFPIITHERFKNNISVFGEKFKQNHGFEMLSEDQMDEIDIYYIEESIFDKLVEEKGSLFAAKVFLLNNRYQPLEDAIEKIFDSILKKYQIEGVLNWAAHFASIRYVANKINADVITMEYSLRFPNYYPICYFCFDDIYETEEIKNGYIEFMKQIDKLDFKLFSREELLTIFLDDSTINYLYEYNRKAKYEMGVAGCHPLVTTFFAKSMFTDIEITQHVRQNYLEKDILFRMHPGEEPYQATYGFENQDTSKNSIEFIIKSKRVAAQGSNIIFEAMLWNRTVYSHDVSPFAQFCKLDFEDKRCEKVDVEFLNYVMFAYFVPLKKAFSPEYMCWRCSKPNIIDVFWDNLCFYLEERNLSKDIIYSSERLKMLKKSRGLV